jgi:hypothetical protein
LSAAHRTLSSRASHSTSPHPSTITTAIFGDENASHDVHCKICGSLLFSVVRNGEFVHVTLGTLDDTPAIRPTAHIFVGSKAAWYSITDQLPQFDEFDN